MVWWLKSMWIGSDSEPFPNETIMCQSNASIGGLKKHDKTILVKQTLI